MKEQENLGFNSLQEAIDGMPMSLKEALPEDLKRRCENLDNETPILLLEIMAFMRDREGNSIKKQTEKSQKETDAVVHQLTSRQDKLQIVRDIVLRVSDDDDKLKAGIISADRQLAQVYVACKNYCNAYEKINKVDEPVS